MASPTSLALIFLLSFLAILIQSQSFHFIYNGFNESNMISQDGSTILKPSGALKLTNNTHGSIGRAFYSVPIPMFDKNTSFSSPNASSFSTYFVFQIVPSSGNQGGFGLAFIIAPSMQFPGAQADHYLGIFNPSNDGNLSNHIFAVEFDTVNGYKENSNSEGNHIGVNNNSMRSYSSESAAYYEGDTHAKEEFKLESGKPIQAWIEYDGVNKILNVTVSPLSKPTRPIKPLISQLPTDLSLILSENTYVGFSAATGEKSSSHYILGWSFRLNGKADPLNTSQLPQIPFDRTSSSLRPQIKIALLVSLPLFVIFLLGILVFEIFRRRKWSESPDDWELSCPHRFRYKDLYQSTKGFKESELLGVGGFGKVYKGVLPTSSGAEIAVKKISSNSIQGLREFAAEIESLGRLRHKNLVNLQGWCKRKNVLLLVYDYIPNGSLDSLLLSPKNEFTISWEQRFKILEGIASGLLYLHEEWEQVVIHRDVKSSNVLIDGDMNARLGDFGLARLYDHGQISHTTNVVGTIGYIAPELAQTGKASTSSDVYAFGVLILEVACGRGAVIRDDQNEHIILVNWVIERHQMGRILDAADPKLESSFVVEEMELILGLGLLCSHHKPEFRPSMRQVMWYLNGDEPLPVFDKLNSSSLGSREVDSMTLRFLDVISTGTITTPYRSSSTGEISSSSMENGR